VYFVPILSPTVPADERDTPALFNIGRRFRADFDRVLSRVRHPRGHIGLVHESQYSEKAQGPVRVQAFQKGRVQMRHRGREQEALQRRGD